MRSLSLLLAALVLLCASCAGRDQNDDQPRVTVKGQYDVSIGVKK